MNRFREWPFEFFEIAPSRHIRFGQTGSSAALFDLPTPKILH